MFVYSDTLMDIQGVKENIEYRLPLNNEELYNWGGLLHNCLFSYSHHISNNRSTIFGLFIDDMFRYVIEIQKNRIVQVSAAYNKPLDEAVRGKIDRWYKEVYLPILWGLC